MKKGKLQGIFDQIQRQNYRLKQQIITLRKHLNTYEQKMMNELTKIDPKTIIYSSPLQCLEAFTQQLAEITENYRLKVEEIEQLGVKARQWEYKYQICKENNARIEQRLFTSQQKIQQQQQKAKQKEQNLLKQIQQLKQLNQKRKYEYEKIQNQLQLKQIEIGEQKRVALAAMNYQKQKQMNQFRQSIQKQYLGQSSKLQQQLKQKDEKIRSLLKGLIKNERGEKLSSQEIGEMRKLVQFIGNIQKLNDEIMRLKDDSFNIKKEMKDIQNKKSASDLKAIQLRNQLSNQLIKYHKKQAQNAGLQQICDKLKADLIKQQQSTKKLEYYFQVKWNNQFQNVRANLQKNHLDKVKQMASQVQLKKAQISRKIQSYVFIHEQDKKIVGELKKKVSTNEKKIRRLQEQLSVKDEKMQSLNNEMFQMNLMSNEDKQSFKQSLFIVLTQKNKKINELSKQIQQFCIDKQAYQQKIKQQKLSIQQHFQHQRQRLITHYSQEIQSIHRVNLQQLTKQRQLHKNKLQQLRNQQNQLKSRYQRQILLLRQQHRQQIEKLSYLVEDERKIQAECLATSQVRQKSFKKQLLDLKQYYMKKIGDQQNQLDNKKATIRVMQQKSQNDQVLKKDLRSIIQQKTYQYKQLQKLYDELKDELQALASEINHLNHQNSGLRLNRDDWLKIILEVKDDYTKQFHQLKEIHARQVQIFKSKIWQLENIILKRPIRIQDEKKIRNLSEQKKELQNKIEIKQAENIVLKQIKHYYQRQKEVKNSSSEMNLTDFNFKKQTVIIANKRSRRTKMNFYESMKKSTEQQQQTEKDITKMRKYLNRCRQSIVPQGQDPTKVLTRLRQTSRVQANFSSEK